MPALTATGASVQREAVLALTAIAARARWLDAPGVPGVCRGMYRVVCAPLVLPYSVVSGAASPWSKEQAAGGTNKVAGIAGRGAVTPLAVAVGSLAGAGGCVADTLSGTADICSFGYYGVRERELTGETDSRPAVAQLLGPDESGRAAVAGDDQSKPQPSNTGQQTISFPVH